MSFGRHHRRTEVQEQPVKKTVALKKEVIKEPVKTVAIEETKPPVEEHKEIIIPISEKVIETKKDEPEEIETLDRLKKKRIYNATNYIGIVGNNIVCKDFRAITKKKGLQINTTLEQILHKWNTENYCL